MRRLFVPGYYCGFSNNKMSLDIAIVLAYLTGRALVPYRFRLPRRASTGPNPGQWPEPVLITDLFEIPVPWSDECLLKTWVSVHDKLDCPWHAVFNSVLCFPADLPRDTAMFQQFLNGRRHVHAFDEKQNEAADLHIGSHTLGHYSYFFYLDDDHRGKVIDLMRQLRPKQPYLDAADRLAESVGKFNAIHVRRGDFLSNALSKEGITRAATVSGEELVVNLASRMRREDTLVICTDGAPEEEIFGPIRKYFHEVIFLDHYLGESAAAKEVMGQLPRDNEAVRVLLTQLIASRAQVFAGTLFSTFTALIHRLRGFADPEAEFLYCYNDFVSPLVRFENCEFLPVQDGAYTWNRLGYPVSPDAFSWFREWPEAFRSVTKTAIPSTHPGESCGTTRPHG